MRIFTHAACLAHDPGPGHAESPARLEAVLDELHARLPSLVWIEAPRASRAQLERVHAPELITQVLDSPVEEFLRLDVDTVMSPGSAQAALRACGAGIAAVDALFTDEREPIFCAVRPPGHHATATTAMGFCLFNGIAVAAAHALEVHSLQRVAILDFDVHHGNGTQHIFEHDPRVLYLSSHQSPLYPGTGDASEHGVGNVVNAPLPPLSGSAAFRDAWTGTLFPALDAFAPQLILVSAGFDAHRLDPLAQLNLEADDYRWIGAELRLRAEMHTGGRILSILEGGYSLVALRECCIAYLEGLGRGGYSAGASG